ncbi:hypothetical protein OV450_8346 [Actinobacteria bacterium OV450]|nr:hypothetical protein OV450_8346 [Actinobacteria bacterium OV450]
MRPAERTTGTQTVTNTDSDLLKFLALGEIPLGYSAIPTVTIELSMVSVLLTAACAVLAGARPYLAIGQWARNAPQDTLARLGIREADPLAVRPAPSASTLRRVLLAVYRGGLADLLGATPSTVERLAEDGKTARGSRTAAAHLLAAVSDTGQILFVIFPGEKTQCLQKTLSRLRKVSE